MVKFVNYIAILLFVVFSFSFAQQNSKRIADIKSSVVCEMCKERIEKQLKKVKGILNVDVILDTKTIKVEFDTTKVSLADIKLTISKIGYDADEVKKDPKAYKKLPKCCRIDG
ncbi:MAG: cation transporter [Ignavibacteria bacterium]|nr:cation transporter [Ignavibacteria bacterium]